MMHRRWFAWLGFAALAVAVLFIAADPASAQRFGRSGFYYSPATGFGYGNPGYGNPYYGNPYYGGGYSPYYGANSPWQYGYGWGNYPTYSRGWGYNNSYNYPGYSGAWWNAPGYGQSTGGYYGEGMPADYYSSTTGTTTGMTSPAGTMGQRGMSQQGRMSQTGSMDGRVLINVRVAPDAEVWFDDQKTSQTGPVRSFITPSLNPDQDFVYHIRARWTENGHPVDKTRRIDVHAGDRLFVNFLGRQQEGTGGTSGQYGAPPANGEDRSLENRDRTLENRERGAQENPDRALKPNTSNTTPTTPPNKTNQPPVKQP
jgi:uncharacterized protein (TIGR03000 family)